MTHSKTVLALVALAAFSQAGTGWATGTDNTAACAAEGAKMACASNNSVTQCAGYDWWISVTTPPRYERCILYVTDSTGATWHLILGASGGGHAGCTLYDTSVTPRVSILAAHVNSANSVRKVKCDGSSAGSASLTYGYGGFTCPSPWAATPPPS